MDWKRSDQLDPAVQTRNPVEVIGHLEELLPQAELPPLDHRWFLELWGDNKTTPRLRTWAHKDGDKLAAHFIAVRGGTTMHTDPGFVRYSVHLELYNGGFFVHGLDTDPDNYPLYEPGLVTVLDTWSPHKVSRDPRTAKRSPSKLAAAIDFVDYPPSVPDAVERLAEHLPSLLVTA